MEVVCNPEEMPKVTATVFRGALLPSSRSSLLGNEFLSIGPGLVFSPLTHFIFLVSSIGLSSDFAVKFPTFFAAEMSGCYLNFLHMYPANKYPSR